VNGARLTAAREARRELAFLDAWEARHGDPDVLRGKIEQLIAVNERVFAEQQAELGYLPESVEGCIGVLHVASRILELIGEADA
jgi:hypothetical protein